MPALAHPNEDTMKKIAALVASALLIIGLSTSASAKMKVDSFQKMTDHSFTGKILGVSYHNMSSYDANEVPYVTVRISDDKLKNNIIEMSFSGPDMMYASSLATALGMNVYVLFSPDTKEATQFSINIEQNKWWHTVRAEKK